MNRMTGRIRGLLASCAVLLAVAACGARGPVEGVATGAAPPAATAAAPDLPARETGDAAASRIFIDPATGAPREPTPEELAELSRREAAVAAQSAKTGASPAAPQEFQLPDGTVGVRFPANSSQPLMACRRLDGQVDEHCHLPALPVRPAAPPATSATPPSGKTEAP